MSASILQWCEGGGLLVGCWKTHWLASSSMGQTHLGRPESSEWNNGAGFTKLCCILIIFVRGAGVKKHKKNMTFHKHCKYRLKSSFCLPSQASLLLILALICIQNLCAIIVKNCYFIYYTHYIHVIYVYTYTYGWEILFEQFIVCN